jgi:hypothetical protein
MVALGPAKWAIRGFPVMLSTSLIGAVCRLANSREPGK